VLELTACEAPAPALLLETAGTSCFASQPLDAAITPAASAATA